MKDHRYSYEEIENIANFLKDNVSLEPKIGIICGTGLGPLAEILQAPTAFEYKNIPNFPTTTVQGHKGRLVFGTIGSIPVVCMQGRLHYYEGHSLSKCVMPVRLMKLLGVETLILSNAAGSVNRSYSVGDVMLIRDHLNLPGFAGVNPLRGPNEDRFGPRFVPMNDCYSPRILKAAREVAAELGLRGTQEGVYACLGGPTFKTVAELRALGALGADAVGMSTVHEVIAARHCGMRCFAFSLITNVGVMEYESEEEPDHEAITSVGLERSGDLKRLIEGLLPRLSDDGF